VKLLILTPQRPYPLHQGTTIRNFHIIAQLAKRHEITLLTFDPSPSMGGVDPLPTLCKHIKMLPVPQRTMMTRLWQMMTTNRPDMSWRLWSPAFNDMLKSCLEQTKFDVIQIEGIEMAPYLPTIRQFAPKSHVVYDDHNAEWLLQYRNFSTDIKIPHRWIGALYSFIQTKRLKQYERWACQSADTVIAVSEADKRAILQLEQCLDITVVPNGVDVKKYSEYHGEVNSFDLVFTGKMDYRPNIDAMLWFADEVLPLILQTYPKSTLAIVGQKPHRRLNRLQHHPNITITGYVTDILPYIAGAKIYITPFRIGGGTRLKILQAMAMQKAIVTTTVGAEGFPVEDGKHMCFADTPHDMANLISSLFEKPIKRKELGKHAYQFVATQYDWQQLIPKMETWDVLNSDDFKPKVF